jgi:Ca-activated chloride channel family protein
LYDISLSHLVLELPMNIRELFNQYRKVLWFAGFGAAGCAAAALLAELWLLVTFIPPQPAPVTVCLLLDSSGSMAGDKLNEMKRAASDLVQRQTLARDQLAVVGFDSFAQVACPLSNQKGPLLAAINGLQVGGGTNMAEGLRTADTALDQSKSDKYILLFTDGMPDSQADALAAASACQSSGTRIVAVATGDANTGYLAQLTHNPSLVFAANAGQFDQAFQHAEKAIYSRQLVESDPSGVGFSLGVIRIAIWTSLLAIGVGLGLIAGQNLYLHRAALTKPEAIAESSAAPLPDWWPERPAKSCLRRHRTLHRRSSAWAASLDGPWSACFWDLEFRGLSPI